MKIEEVHKENFRLIEKHNIAKGNVLRLICDFKYFKKGNKFTISHIHSLYGWVLFEENGQLPQEVSELLKVTDIKYNLGCGRMFKIFNNQHIEVYDVDRCDFICGVANGNGQETLCQVCDFKIKEQWRKEDMKK